MKYVIGVGGVVLVGAFLFLVGSGGQDVRPENVRSDHGQTVLFPDAPVRADGEFTVVTSFYPLAFALERIGGDLVAVENIGAGRDPHDFEPSVQGMQTLLDADLVALQGAGYEPWGDAVRDQLEAERVSVVVATAELDLRAGGHDHAAEQHDDGEPGHAEDHAEDHEDEHADESEADGGDGAPAAESQEEHAHGAFDPHTWLDPVRMSETVEQLAEALVTLDPENAATYEANAATLQAELAELDAYYATALRACELSEVITSHDAFGYVGARYDFEIHSIAGLSTQDSPSAVVLAELREEAQEGIGAILLEESSVTAYGETLSRETGLQTLTINPIAFLIPDGEDYFSLSRANAAAFATALQCNE